jgi:hypothetical protein
MGALEGAEIVRQQGRAEFDPMVAQGSRRVLMAWSYIVLDIS